jgi:hypothetical protein
LSLNFKLFTHVHVLVGDLNRKSCACVGSRASNLKSSVLLRLLEKQCAHTINSWGREANPGVI